MKGTFHEIPSELEDAAIVDGCSPLQAWYKIMMPLSKGGTVAVTVLTYIAIWEEFTFAATLMPSALYQTLPVGIKFLKDEAQSKGMVEGTLKG